MTNEKSIIQVITVKKINELSKYIIDVYGADLSLEELNESIYLVLEDVPGIELSSIHDTKLLTTQIRNQYHDETRCRK